MLVSGVQLNDLRNLVVALSREVVDNETSDYTGRESKNRDDFALGLECKYLASI